MQERMKEHGRDIRFARTQNSAVSEHANKLKPDMSCCGRRQGLLTETTTGWYTRKVKEEIH